MEKKSILKIVLVLIVLLVLTAVVLRTVQFDTQFEETGSTSSDEMSVDEGQLNHLDSAESHDTDTAQESTIASERLVDEILNLLERAEAGELEAVHEVQFLSELCTGYVQAYDDLREYHVKQEMPEFFIGKLDEDFDTCSHLETMAAISELAEDYKRQLIEANYPSAIADQLVTIAVESGFEVADQYALDVLGSRNGEAINKVIPYLNYRDKTKFEVGDQSSVTLKKARNNALTLLACHYDWNGCDVGSRVMLNMCGYQHDESCFRSMNLTEYLETYEWSPAEAQAAFVAFEEFLAMIERGELEEILTLGGSG